MEEPNLVAPGSINEALLSLRDLWNKKMQGRIAPSACRNRVKNHQTGFSHLTLSGNRRSVQVDSPAQLAKLSLSTESPVIQMNQIETLFNLATCLN